MNPSKRVAPVALSVVILLAVVGWRSAELFVSPGSAWASSAGAVHLTLHDERIDVELTLEPDTEVTLRFSRALEDRLTRTRIQSPHGWRAVSPSIGAEGAHLILRFPAGETTTLGWSVEPPTRWTSPISGAATDSLLVVPATTLLPIPEGEVGAIPLSWETTRAASDRILFPLGPVTLAERGEVNEPLWWQPSDPRWSGGLLAAGDFRPGPSVARGDRLLRTWRAGGGAERARSAFAAPDSLEAPIEAAVQLVAAAFERIGPARSSIASDLLIVPPAAGPHRGSRMAWAGTHVVRADEDVAEAALELAVSQLLCDLPDRSALWIVHGLRRAVPAHLRGRRDELRLDLWDRYSSLRAWQLPVERQPSSGPAMLHSAWAHVAAPLAVEHLIERSVLSPERTLAALADLTRDTREDRRIELFATLGARAAAFHGRCVRSFELMPPPEGVLNITSLELAERSADEGEDFTFVVTANQYGYLETCGCVLNQNGGAARRNTLIAELKRDDPNALVLDAGNFLAPPTDLTTKASAAEVKTFVETLGLAPYDAISASPTDVGSLIEAWGDALPQALEELPFPVLSGNARAEAIVVGDELRQAWSPAATLEQGGRRIDVFGWTGHAPEQVELENGLVRTLLEGVRLSDPFLEVERWLARLTVDSMRIVSGQLSPALVNQLVARFPEIDVVISARYHAMTPSREDRDLVHLYGQSGLLGDTLVLYGTSGYYGLGLHRARRTVDGEWVALRSESLEFGDHIEDHAPTRLRIESHYERAHPPEAWAVRPIFPSRDAGIRPGVAEPEFVGSQACAQCHSDTYDHWLGTEHGTAYETLLAVRRQYVPDCVKCHVVGLGTPSGFQPDHGVGSPLKGVGCEQCHGPGSVHVSLGTQESIQRSLPEPGCAACHDSEHSPAFEANRAAYLERIRHW